MVLAKLLMMHMRKLAGIAVRTSVATIEMQSQIHDEQL